MTEVYRARGMVPGKASGSAVVSRRAFTFAHGVDPSSGRVTDVHSDLDGTSLKGKVLFYPFGKGSTTGSAWFLETARLGNEPAGVVTEDPDLSVIIGSLLARTVYSKSIPVLFAGADVGIAVKTGEQVAIDGATGEIVVG